MPYSEEDMLMLSGIQHYMFCPRQWALIHLEQQWNDNKLTVEGGLLHTNVDNPFYRQKNGDVITLRSVSIASKQLGLYGISDAIELHTSETSENAIIHPRYQGWWIPYPIEYKRGHSKSDERDEVQLVAQVMCLEEMYDIHLDYGALYYGETKRRECVEISPKLRKLTIDCAKAMHQLYEQHRTPKAEIKSSCRSCSLLDLCMPKLSNCSDVKHYLNNYLYEETS
jgi:CRISPR-associated exonuclease Cas4